jgi:hypothetical protein
VFRFSDRHIDQYHRDGYCVFERIVPPALMRDLRRFAEVARAHLRATGDPDGGRLHPLHEQGLDLGPLLDFVQLPPLVAAIAAVAGPALRFGVNAPSLLVEPSESVRCQRWHRDWRTVADGSGGPASAERVARGWEAAIRDPAFFNQFNCPLYDDGSLWVVPGSCARPDLAGELPFARCAAGWVDLGATAVEEAEQAAIAYCRSMPGAHRLTLAAGDFALYRDTLWHLGLYHPLYRRATLHDAITSDAYDVWWRAWLGERYRPLDVGAAVASRAQRAATTAR